MSINNFLNYSRNKFYDISAYLTGNQTTVSHDVVIDETFRAEYSYGPKEEQIVKKNIIINFFQTLLARLLLSHIYPGVSLEFDKKRILKTKQQFKAIGGKFVSL